MVAVAYGRTLTLADTGRNKSGQSGGSVDPRLAPAAHEFEASLMQELLKPMEHDPLFSSGGGLMSGDAGAGTWSSLGAQSLAKAISDAGGLGIATKMISEVEAEAKATQAGKTQAAGTLAGSSAGTLAGSGVDRGGFGGGEARVRPLGGERDLSSWSTVRRLP